nr:MAG TPA: hypothetical protein [Caudoviricetes sp.]
MKKVVHLFASQRVNRKARTDNEEVFREKVTLITNKQMSIGQLADFSQLVKDLAAAGIVISGNQVAIKAKQTSVIGSDGSTIALFDTEGKKLNANLIDAINIVTQALQTGTIKAGDAVIENLKASNINLSGSFRSPFVPVGRGYESKFADNISLVTRNGTLDLHIKSTGLDQVGRVIHLTHFKWNDKNADYGNVYIDVPEGFFIYENGVAFQKIRLSRECVTLLGLGDDKNFFGWCVIGRCDLMTNRSYGRNKKVLAYGRVDGTSSGASIKYRTFDGSKLSVNRLGTGEYQILVPRKWFLSKEDGLLNLDAVFVTLTGIGYSYDDKNKISPIKATFWGATENIILGYNDKENICIEVHTSDDETANDGSFNFEISNFDDFDYLA